jgi:hypothetical protein
MSTNSRRKPPSRPDHKRKLSHRGTKCVRAQAANHWGEKKQRLELSLTPTAIEAFENLAVVENISVSELLERLARCSTGLSVCLSAGRLILPTPPKM